jgi:hypothetical protein
MKPTSLLFVVARTPTCSWRRKPGGRSDLPLDTITTQTPLAVHHMNTPEQELSGVVKPEHALTVLDVVL